MPRAIAGEVGGSDRGNSPEPGVGAARRTNGGYRDQLTRPDKIGLCESASCRHVIEILMGSNRLLHGRNLHDAPGLIRRFTVILDPDEKHCDQSQEDGDDNSDFDKGEPGFVLASVVEFHETREYPKRTLFKRKKSLLG
jgi:hypothetical protein